MAILLYDLVGSDVSKPFSPHCWKVAMALCHKGLDFTAVPTTFTEVPSVENGVSPTIPVIRDGGSIVADSFAIAEYLDGAYPLQASLFGGEGGHAMARFVERWSQTQLHPVITRIIILDLVAGLAPRDADYFRSNREQRFGKTLEAIAQTGPEARAELVRNLEPLRSMLGYQDFIGGATPLFSDYIVFGALQWARVCGAGNVLAPDDPVAAWFERCLDLHSGLGRRVTPFGN